MNSQVSGRTDFQGFCGIEGCSPACSSFSNGQWGAWVLKGGVLLKWGSCCLPPPPALHLDLGRKYTYTQQPGSLLAGSCGDEAGSES